MAPNRDSGWESKPCLAQRFKRFVRLYFSHFKYLNISGDQIRPDTKKYTPLFGLNITSKPAVPEKGNATTPSNISVANDAA